MVKRKKERNRYFQVPWTGGDQTSQSILKEVSPEYSLKRLMLKLKLQYFGHLMRRADSLEKTPMLRKIEGRRRRDDRGRDGWMASPTQRTWAWANTGRGWRTVKLVSSGLLGRRVAQDWATDKNKRSLYSDESQSSDVLQTSRVYIYICHRA